MSLNIGSRTTLARQCASAVLMVRPAHLFVDPHTASTNALQTVPAVRVDRAHEGQVEFDRLAETLDRAGVRVCVRPAPAGELPDALFPNNWISMHADGTVILYPMLAPLRRLERDPDTVAALERDFGFAVRRTLDLSPLESRAAFVEGTGSLIFDHANRMAYAALSPRTTTAGVEAACEALGYRAMIFHARHASGTAIYHTNVMLSIGTRLAVGCFGTVQGDGERARIVARLEESGRQIVDLTESQMLDFGANCLELDARGEPLLALSRRAWGSLRAPQRRALERVAGICAVAVDTIERVGGGSVRCMLAEIFLPRRP